MERYREVQEKSRNLKRKEKGDYHLRWLANSPVEPWFDSSAARYDYYDDELLMDPIINSSRYLHTVVVYEASREILF
jgi:hypothetical protein